MSAVLSLPSHLADREMRFFRSSAALDRHGHILISDESFRSEDVDRRETGLSCDAVPKVYRKADIAGPKRIPSAADE
jgi:hypothetical protein